MNKSISLKSILFRYFIVFCLGFLAVFILSTFESTYSHSSCSGLFFCINFPIYLLIGLFALGLWFTLLMFSLLKHILRSKNEQSSFELEQYKPISKSHKTLLFFMILLIINNYFPFLYFPFLFLSLAFIPGFSLIMVILFNFIPILFVAINIFLTFKIRKQINRRELIGLIVVSVFLFWTFFERVMVAIFK